MTAREITPPLIRASLYCLAAGLLLGAALCLLGPALFTSYIVVRSGMFIFAVAGGLMTWCAGVSARLQSWLLLIPVGVGIVTTAVICASMEVVTSQTLREPGTQFVLVLYPLIYFAAAILCIASSRPDGRY